jgi:hypothetical protein
VSNVNHVIAITSPGPQGIQGPAGTTLRYGAGVPGSGVGVDGDFYIDTTNDRLYGPKATGAWPGAYVDLIGPTGPTGPTGSTGPAGPANTLTVGTVTAGGTGDPAAVTITGTAPSQTVSFVLPKGDTGPTGPTGPEGPAANLGSATPLALASSGAAGSNSAASRQDHVHPTTGLLVKSDFNNKGDIFVASANDTSTVLPVGTDGQIIVANSAETSGLQWVDNFSEKLYLTVKNQTGTTIAKGKAVYIDGVSGTIPTVVLADATSDVTSAYTLGLTAASIADGATGYVITKGILKNISTTGLTGGAPVWLSETAGEITSTRPTQPAHGVLIGYAVRIHGSNGEIYIFTQNGYELGELHDVLITGTPANGQALVYDSATSLWKNGEVAADEFLAYLYF